MESAATYRVTIRYRGTGSGAGMGYEVLEIEASDLREALTRTAERFPERVMDSADLVEIRVSNPAGAT